ncbi:unnamed protein product, partial [Pylaiella littoralis]
MTETTATAQPASTDHDHAGSTTPSIPSHWTDTYDKWDGWQTNQVEDAIGNAIMNRTVNPAKHGRDHTPAGSTQEGIPMRLVEVFCCALSTFFTLVVRRSLRSSSRRS